jgi:hypothetical protein
LSNEACKVYKKELKKLQEMVQCLEASKTCNEKFFYMDRLLFEIKESKYAIKMNPNIRKKIKNIASNNEEFYSQYTNIVSEHVKDYYYN